MKDNIVITQEEEEEEQDNRCTAYPVTILEVRAYLLGI